MVFALAGLRCEGETVITDAEYIDKSFATFIPEMIKAGARFEVVDKNFN
jgi:5-enolpyruvylshikimate-3-phosphate synthase